MGMSILSVSTSGIYQASARFEKAASQTVSDASSGKDILSDLVDQMESRNAFQASISVIKAADNMVGRVLDMKI